MAGHAGPDSRMEGPLYAGSSAGAALGLGAEAHLRIKWSTTTHKFYFNVHAGLVVGPGASGEFAAEVDAGTFVTMVKCIYNALLKSTSTRLKLIPERLHNSHTLQC